MSEALVPTDDAALFNDPDFTRAVQERTRARARAAFHGRGVDRLIEMAEGGDDRTALSAITMLGKLAGEFKAPRPIQLNFEGLMKEAQAATPGPLTGITQIVESAVIDAEEEGDDE